jgi:hypothetical protein
MGQSGHVYRICAETFAALGDGQNLQAVLEAGNQALMDLAEIINVPAWCQSFLGNVSDHRALYGNVRKQKAVRR